MKKTAGGTADPKNTKENPSKIGTQNAIFNTEKNSRGGSIASFSKFDCLLETDPWSWWREQMPVTKKWTYLDHAAVGPLSGPAARAIRGFAEQAADSGDVHWPSWSGNADQLRRQFSQLLNSQPSEISLVPNTTAGVNLIAEGFPWEKGDNVVIPEGEFPSNLFPWQNQQSKGVEMRLVPRRGREVRVDDLMDQVDERTRLISVSWVGYASGFRMDLDRLVELAHQRGVLVFVDAIQGLGVFPLDLQKTPVDFLAADGHKWLLGPEGIGVAMIRKQHLDRLRCGQVGWNSVKNAFNYACPELHLRDAASRFEGGSLNLMGVAALNASVELFIQIRKVHGENSIAERILSLSQDLDSRLRQLGIESRLMDKEAHRSGILTFEIPGVDPAAFRKAALSENVVLSCRDGGIRASIHAYNNEDDLSRLMQVVGQHVV